jgi:hypothetical protein
VKLRTTALATAAVVLWTGGTVVAADQPASASRWVETCILSAKKHGNGRARIIDTSFSSGPVYRVVIYTLCSPDYHAVYAVRHSAQVNWRHIGKDHNGHVYHYHPYGKQLRLPCDSHGRRRMARLDVRGHLIGADHFPSPLYNDKIYTRPLTYKFTCWDSGGGPWGT